MRCLPFLQENVGREMRLGVCKLTQEEKEACIFFQLSETADRF